MKKVDEFVEAKKDTGRNEQLVINVKSMALKKQLARDIAKKHKDSSNVFTEFRKDSEAFIVKRWAKRNNQTNPEEVKTTTPIVQSEETFAKGVVS